MVPGEKARHVLTVRPRPQDPGTWWLSWSRAGEQPVVFQGSLDELSEWAYAHGFTGVEVRPPTG